MRKYMNLVHKTSSDSDAQPVIKAMERINGLIPSIPGSSGAGDSRTKGRAPRRDAAGHVRL